MLCSLKMRYRQSNEGPMPGKPSVGPIDINKVPWEARKKTIEAANLIKQKRKEELALLVVCNENI